MKKQKKILLLWKDVQQSNENNVYFLTCKTFKILFSIRESWFFNLKSKKDAINT